jgi:hypothetical protein
MKALQSDQLIREDPRKSAVGPAIFPVYFPAPAVKRSGCPRTSLPLSPLLHCRLDDSFGNLNTMEVHFTPEQESQLAQLATKAGIEAEQLVKEVVLRLLEDNADVCAAAELPIWRLGTVGSFHRRDIYNDVH